MSVPAILAKLHEIQSNHLEEQWYVAEKLAAFGLFVDVQMRMDSFFYSSQSDASSATPACCIE